MLGVELRLPLAPAKTNPEEDERQEMSVLKSRTLCLVPGYGMDQDKRADLLGIERRSPCRLAH